MERNIVNNWFISRKTGFKEFRREMNTLSLVFLIATFSFFFIFLVIPLFLVIINAFMIDSKFSFDNFSQIIIFDPSHQFLNLNLKEWGFENVIKEEIKANGSHIFVLSGINSSYLINTLFVGLFTTIFSLVIGVSLAYIMAKYEFFGKEIVRLIIVIPLVVPPFIGALGLKRMFGIEYSVFNNLFYRQLHIMPFALIIEGLSAVIIVQTLHFYTLVYLNSLSAFMNIDPSLEEQGENLGSSGFNLFRKITFPLATPGIAAGAILTFILSIEDLGTPLIFGDAQSKSLLAPVIFFAVTNAAKGITYGPTQVYSVVMLLISALGFFAIRKYVGLKQYATYSKGGTFNKKISKFSPLKTTIFYFIFIPFAIFSLSPHIGTFLISISTFKSWNPTAGNVLPITIDTRAMGLVLFPVLLYLLLLPFKKYNLKPIHKIMLTSVVLVALGKIVIDTINFLYFGLDPVYYFNSRGTYLVTRAPFGPDIFIVIGIYFLLLTYVMYKMIFKNKTKSTSIDIKPSSIISDFTTNYIVEAIIFIEILIGFYVIIATGSIWDPYIQIFSDSVLLRATINSFILAFVAIILIVVLGIASSYILARKNFYGKSILDLMVTIPIAVPGVVLAMGYLMLVAAFNPFYIPLHQFLFGRPGSANMDKENNVIFFILIMAYTVRRFPFTVRSAYAGLQQTHETFEEAAYNLGSSPSRTLRKIVIPLIGSNVFAGALVSFVYSLSESSTTLIWVTNENTATIPYLIYTNYTETITAQNSAAALGVLLIGVQIIAISISNFILRKRGSALTGL